MPQWTPSEYMLPFSHYHTGWYALKGVDQQWGTICLCLWLGGSGLGNLSLCHSRITDQMIHRYRELTATTDEEKAKNKKNARPGPPLDTCGRQERVINSSSQNEPDINKHRVIRTDYRGSTMYVGASSCIQSTYPPLTCLRRFSILALYACVDIGSLSSCRMVPAG